ncbi:MAG: hypothetical protein ACK4ON_03115 [Bacteroidia bacterium]
MNRIVLLLVAIMALASCRKYKEDPITVVLQKPEKRILGQWQCTEILVNDIDSTSYLKDTVGVWEFFWAKDDAFQNRSMISNYSYAYYFIDKKKTLELYSSYLTSIKEKRNRWLQGETLWQIIAINNRELKLKSEPINNTIYTITFRKTYDY